MYRCSRCAYGMCIDPQAVLLDLLFETGRRDRPLSCFGKIHLAENLPP